MPSKDMRPEDFDAIREAVMETPRGRWFLEQYAERLRTAETQGMISGIKRLEKAVAANHDALMSRLASALEAGAPSARAPSAAPPPDLAPRHMKYFLNDEDIFEPAPRARIAAVPDLPPEPLPLEEPEASPKRRIVIIRHKPGEQIDVPLADELAEAS
jgi:hypothetical protein